jgi:hypothetical protein
MLVKAVRSGLPQSLCAPYAGVSPRTYGTWLRVGEDALEDMAEGKQVTPHHAACARLLEAIREARATVAASRVKLVHEAAQGGQVVKETTRRWHDPTLGMVEETDRQYSYGDWRAAAWLLSRGYPEFASDAAKIEVSGPGGGPVQVEHDVTRVAARVAAAVAARREDPVPLEPDRDGVYEITSGS